MELFGNQSNTTIKPLAERCRPKSFKDFYGQEHIVGKGGIIQSMIQKRALRSLILWGPPGSGKTTLAHLIAIECNVELFVLNAISSGVSDVRKVIEKGKVQSEHYGRQCILLIDEIHRFNKGQQDSLLHAVEQGEVVLIGATTENPSFEVNPPLLSRCQVLQLKSLDHDHVKTIIQSAIQNDPTFNKLSIEINDESLEKIALLSNGDARVALKILESSIELSLNQNNHHVISPDLIEKASQKRIPYHDKQGEYHYNVISAFIKSMRGSDPQAALYYLAVMLEGGEDIEFIARRMIILASEDIGNADPQALILASSCLTAIKNIGMPEARIILSQVVAYLSAAPKSNSSYTAIEQALSTVRDREYDIPFHLRNAPTKLMKDLKYGKNYQYPHNFDQHFVKENYLPDELQGKIFYQPTDQGYEKQIRAYLTYLWGENYDID